MEGVPHNIPDASLEKNEKAFSRFSPLMRRSVFLLAMHLGSLGLQGCKDLQAPNQTPQSKSPRATTEQVAYKDPDIPSLKTSLEMDRVVPGWGWYFTNGGDYHKPRFKTERLSEGSLHVESLRGRWQGKETVLSGEDFQTLIVDTYPKGWTEGQIAGVQQHNEIPEDSAYVKGEDTLGSADQDSGAIHFWKPSLHQNLEFLVKNSFSHELCHQNDWMGSRSIQTEEERGRFLLDVAKRSTAKDRFKSAYVEGIECDYVEFNKATEYWAEICSQYFQNPDKLHIKDFQIVDQVVHKADPEFNTKEKALARDMALREALGAPKTTKNSS